MQTPFFFFVFSRFEKRVMFFQKEKKNYIPALKDTRDTEYEK
jgi:hypothetical protein